MGACRLNQLLPEHALAHYKILIREAARLTRNHFNEVYRNEPNYLLGNLVLISRLVAFNKHKQAALLIHSSNVFSSRIVVSSCVVSLVDPAAFAEEFRALKSYSLQRTIQRETAAPKPNKGKLSAASRLSLLWKAAGPTNSVAAITSDEGVRISEPVEMASSLGSSWSRTFSKREGVPPGAQAFLAGQCPQWSFEGVLPPDVEAIYLHLLSLKDSAPGPDGIPYSCYKALARYSAMLLYKANLVLLAGGIISMAFNFQRGVFIPKNSPTDGLDPRADELRTLGLKNSDIKAITGANIKQFDLIVAQNVTSIQRGFVMGRQLVLNVVDLDTITRALANLGFFPLETILALWDFLAAFPSLRHAWVLLVFRMYGFPSGFCRFLEALLFHNFAIFSSRGVQVFLYLILAGIVQGCPSAGMMFAVAADPFFKELKTLQNRLKSNDGTPMIAFRGCADDIGAALASFRFLQLCKPIFDKAKAYSGLTLNPKKCVLVLADFIDFETSSCKLKGWLAANIPDWEGFKIAKAHAYLGPGIGPDANDAIWNKAIDKYWSRVLRVAGLGLSAYYSLLAYNSYCVSCLEYLMQMYSVPPQLLKLEARALSIILKIPHYAYGVDGPFHLKSYGILSARSLLAVNLAALFRASRVTLAGWEKSWRKLVRSLDSRNIGTSISHTLAPPCWEDAPIASRLFSAFNGFRDNYLHSIPPHILRKIQSSFHDYDFLRPDGHPLSPHTNAPLDDQVFKELSAILAKFPEKPKKEAYKVFLRIVHPTALPDLLFKRANRWSLKYLGLSPSLESISCSLAVLKKCGSPFFASLIIRTLAFGWTTGTRFSNSKTDLSRCPFCRAGPQKLGHIIACPGLIRPLISAINEDLRARGLIFRVPNIDCDDLSSIFHGLFPPSPSSPAPLLLMACACDAFQGARNFTFGSRLSLHLFLTARVKLLFKKLGRKFWGMLNPLLQSHASLAPSPRRRGRRRRQSPLAIFSSEAPPFGTKDSRGIGSWPCACVARDLGSSTSLILTPSFIHVQTNHACIHDKHKATFKGSRQARNNGKAYFKGPITLPTFPSLSRGPIAFNFTLWVPSPLSLSSPSSCFHRVSTFPISPCPFPWPLSCFFASTLWQGARLSVLLFKASGTGAAPLLHRLPIHLALGSSPLLPYTSLALAHPLPRPWGGSPFIVSRFFFFGVLVGNLPSMIIALMNIAHSSPPPPLASFLVVGLPSALLPTLAPSLLPSSLLVSFAQGSCLLNRFYSKQLALFVGKFMLFHPCLTQGNPCLYAPSFSRSSVVAPVLLPVSWVLFLRPFLDTSGAYF